MTILEIANISKSFGSVIANRDISLHLKQGEILALLGENGAGKTTLMNILFGQYSADQGKITAFGEVLTGRSTGAALKVGIGMVHQHFTLADNMTVLENVILGTESLLSIRSNLSSARQKISGICERMGLTINLDSQVADLVIGERQRVEILKALYRDAKILILDEPTAVLTPQEVDGLFDMLRVMQRSGLSVIIISHKLQEVLAISQRIVVLRHGSVVGEALTKEVDRDQLAEMIVGHQIQRPKVEAMRAGADVLQLANIRVRGSDQRLRLDGINLNVKAHQIIGIAGVSGNGQSDLANLISGISALESGEFTISGVDCRKATVKQLTALHVARIPEDRHSAGIVGDMSVWENLLLEDLGKKPCWRNGLFINTAKAYKRAEQLIEQFDIRCANMFMPAKLLSGGNIQKLILARNFLLKPKLILANQPVRGLDEGAISFVHQQLINAKKTGSGVLLISEDLDELLRLSDFIQVMHNGHLSKPYATQVLTSRMLGILMSGGELEDADNASILRCEGDNNAI
jgi:simple sugar transport system ATP-binding protein